MARYRRLSLTEREELSRLLAAGSSLRATGRALDRAPRCANWLVITPRPSPIERCGPINGRSAERIGRASRGSWRASPVVGSR